MIDQPQGGREMLKVVWGRQQQIADNNRRALKLSLIRKIPKRVLFNLLSTMMYSNDIFQRHFWGRLLNGVIKKWSKIRYFAA